MNLFRGISLSVGSSCFLFFVCSVEAIFSSYFYIPLLLFAFGVIFTVVGFDTLIPKKHTKKKAKHKKQTNHFIEYLNKTNDFYETYQYALRTPERNNNQNELATQIK